MSTIDMKQVAGLQAVNAEGNVIGTLSVDDLTELVSAKIIQEAKNEAVSARSASVMSEASTLAATDEYEDQLALDTNPAYVRSLDTNGNPKRTAIASLASVVGGLIGKATTDKDGLMPAYRTVRNLYSEGKPVKITIPSNEGFSLLITAVKNHESAGQSIINLSGYSKGFIATNIRRGSYISGISYKFISSGAEIYVKLAPYVFFSSLVNLTSSGKSYSVSLVESVPEDASEMSLP